MRQTGGQRVVAWLVAGLVFAWALPSWAQSWSYRRETDEMTDRTNHFASVRVGSGFRPAVFFAACRNDDLEMWLAPNDYIGSSDDNGPETSRDDSRIYIDYRVNDEPAQEGRLANLSTDEDAFFFQDHADIIRGLIGKRLIVKWRDYRGTSTTLTVPTRGAAAALKKLPCARPYIPNCGDGETQLGEECDEGRKNSNGRGAVCSRACKLAPPYCGNGLVQGDEACDLGKANSDAAEAVCRLDCTNAAPFCGNGAVQGEEVCDLGTANKDGAGAVCTPNCTTAAPVCGDGVLQTDEACDSAIPAEAGAEFVCSSNCELQSIFAELLIPCSFGPSTILIDGLKAGVCGEIIQRIPPGMHTVTRRSDRPGDWVAEVNMVAGKRAETPTLPAVLTVTVNTPDAEILVDGKLLGTSIRAVSAFLVEPNAKQLEVRKPGFTTYTMELSLSPGAPSKVTVALQPVAPIAPAAPVAPPIPAATPVSL